MDLPRDLSKSSLKKEKSGRHIGTILSSPILLTKDHLCLNALHAGRVHVAHAAASEPKLSMARLASSIT